MEELKSRARRQLSYSHAALTGGSEFESRLELTLQPMLDFCVMTLHQNSFLCLLRSPSSPVSPGTMIHRDFIEVLSLPLVSGAGEGEGLIRWLFVWTPFLRVV